MVHFDETNVHAVMRKPLARRATTKPDPFSGWAMACRGHPSAILAVETYGTSAEFCDARIDRPDQRGCHVSGTGEDDGTRERRPAARSDSPLPAVWCDGINDRILMDGPLRKPLLDRGDEFFHSTK